MKTSSTTEALNKAAKWHKRHGDYEMFWAFRREYLLAQAREYQKRKPRRCR